MHVPSKVIQVRLLLTSMTSILILAGIIMELLPEDKAKIFVIPTLIAALFAGVGQSFISK